MAEQQWQNLAANINARKAQRGAIWQNDFFSQMMAKSMDTPTFDYDSETGGFMFQDVGPIADMGTMWNTYKRAAESRGIVPDYMAFMQQYQTMKTTRNSKLLDRFSEKTMQYANSSNFKSNLERELKTNVDFRNSLIKAIRANPEHPNASVAMQYLTQASTPTSPVSDVFGGALSVASPWIPGMMEMPEARKGFGDPDYHEGTPGPGAIRTLGAAGQFGFGMLGGKGMKEAGKGALRTLMPGAGIGGVVKNIKGGKASQSFALKNEMLKKAFAQQAGIKWGEKGALSKLAKTNPKAFKELVGNMSKQVMTSMGIDPATIKYSPDGTIKKSWLDKQKMPLNQKQTLRNLNNMQKNIVAIEKTPLYGKDGKFTQAQLDNMTPAERKAVTKSVERQTRKLDKNINRSGKGLQAQFARALKKKGGTMGFIRWVMKKNKMRGIMLAAKLGVSGVAKGASAVTGGVSGVASLALDAWTLYEISDLIADAIAEPKALEKRQIATTPIDTVNVSS